MLVCEVWMRECEEAGCGMLMRGAVCWVEWWSCGCRAVSKVVVDERRSRRKREGSVT